jgi:hypothetical protein
VCNHTVPEPKAPKVVLNQAFIEWHYLPNDFPENGRPVYLFAKRICEETGEWEEHVFDNCEYNSYEREWTNERGFVFDQNCGTFKILAWAYVPDEWNICNRITRHLISDVRDAIDNVGIWLKEAMNE